MPPARNRRTKGESQSSKASSPSAGKRKQASSTLESDSQPAHVKSSRPSIADLVSSQGSNQSDGVDTSENRLKRKREQEERINGSHSATPRPRTFAEMYTFTSRSKPNGVIDLTGGKSPVQTQPLNGSRNFGQLGQGGPKRLVVKNLRTTPKLDPQEFFDRKWKEQQVALDSLFQGDDVKILLEELYKATEHICRQGKAADLFERLKQKCTEHLDENVRQPLARKAQDDAPVTVLREFVSTWKLWQKQLQTIRHIYFYLNQTYLLHSAEHGDINTMGTQLFRSTVFRDLDIREKVLDGIVEIFQLDRRNDISNGALLKQAVDSFHELGIYVTDLEPILIKASQEYFRTWRTEEAEKADLSHYARSCTDLLNREMTRCDDLSLDRSTRSQISDFFNQIFIEENVERLSNEDSVLDMFEQEMSKELEQTWTLLQRKGHQHLLNPPFSKFTDIEGTVIVFDEKREDEMVLRLLAFKRKLDGYHVNCFHKDDTMGNTLHKSFENFMNKSKKSQSNWDTDNAKPGEMIAKHIDLLLKGGVKAIPKLVAQRAEAHEADNEHDFDEEESDDSAIEKHLADSLDLFRFVHGKAVFEAFYKKDLARRLLMGRTQSFDAERSMLARLRNECGAQFTHNLESMFKDMDLAREEMKAYNQRMMDREIKAPVELAVNVLSVAAWPTYPDIPVNVPTSISKAQTAFENYYKEKHVGRKLTWKPSLAHCQLRGRFPKGYKELVVSGFQAIVLLLFNDVSENESLSYEQIRSATNLPDNELKRTMQSLACAKYRVLTKNPKGRDVNETDTFTYNEKFSDPKLRVKINQIQLKETKEENKETHQRVAADRHYETQAAIVRIMKARKKIGHNELIVEVIKATRSRGVLDQADIKKNIEKLIEKDYMEREDDIKGYSYLA